MKKVVICYDFLLGFGGLERVMAFQANSLKQEFNTTVSFASLEKDVAEDMFKGLKVEEHSIKELKLSFLKIMYSFINKTLLKKYNDANCFISHSYMCSRMCNYMKKKYNIPFIVYIHHPPNFLYLQDKKAKYWGLDIGRGIALLAGIILGPALRKDDKNCIKNADKVLLNSNYTKERIKQIYGVDSTVCYPTINKIFKIHDKSECEYVLKKYEINSKFIFCHGRLIPDKRYEMLVEALANITNKDLLVVFSGNISESYKIQLLELANKLGVKNKMKFLGFIPDNDLVVLYNLAEVFAFPATKEDFGLVPVEAIACGCPAVAWNDNAGPSEIITDGVNGYLANPYDVKDFASKIEKIIKEDFKKKNRNNIADSAKKFSNSEHSKIIKEAVSSLVHK